MTVTTFRLLNYLFSLPLLLRVLLLLLAVTTTPVCSVSTSLGDHFLVLEELPHDDKSFTQGLTYDNDSNRLFESAGLYSRSDIRQVDPVTGTVLQKSDYPKTDFAEGITIYQDAEGKSRLIGITWKQQNGYIYDPDNLDIAPQKFKYETHTNEGWGITYNDKTQEFIVTDGSNWLHFWDRDTLKEKRRIQVVYIAATTKSAGGSTLLTMDQDRLNEIELLDGDDGNYILSNVWETDRIVKIDIRTGVIARMYDFSSLYTNRANSANVLNGISTTDVEGEYWVTGKLWPKMYRVKLLI